MRATVKGYFNGKRFNLSETKNDNTLHWVAYCRFFLLSNLLEIESIVILLAQPRMTMLNVDPKPLNLSAESLNFRLDSLKVGPKSLKVGPKSLKVEPKSLKVEPKSLKVEPKSLKVEPKSLKVGPKSLKVEPKSLKVEPKPLKNESNPTPLLKFHPAVLFNALFFFHSFDFRC